MKILEEISKRSGGVKLREDNILFMLSTRLKDLCNQYGVFIMSATQLSGNFQDSETPDQTLLRGALLCLNMPYPNYHWGYESANGEILAGHAEDNPVSFLVIILF